MRVPIKYVVTSVRLSSIKLISNLRDLKFVYQTTQNQSHVDKIAYLDLALVVDWFSVPTCNRNFDEPVIKYITADDLLHCVVTYFTILLSNFPQEPRLK